MVEYLENERYLKSLVAVIRDKRSSASELQKALRRFGQGMAQHIVAKSAREQKIETPMGRTLMAYVAAKPYTLIVGPRAEKALVKGMQDIIDNSTAGYMDFRGKRGRQLMEGPTRALQMEREVGNESVESLICVKSMLAEGNTAITLAKTAIAIYNPRRVVIASILHTVRGLHKVQESIPRAEILLVVKRPDDINDNGMLIPGVGNLDERLKETILVKKAVGKPRSPRAASKATAISRNG